MTASNRNTPAVSVLGTLADGIVGTGRPAGLVELDDAGIEIEWWIGADDGWKIPSTAGAAVHTIRPGLAPATETRVRVPGGEAVLRVYAIAASGAPLVVADVENASPAAAVVAWVVRGAPGYRIRRVSMDGSMLLIDERAHIALPRAPSHWAIGSRAAGVHDAVVGGRASSGRFDGVATRRGDLEIALLFPVAHRTRTRIAAARATSSRSVVVARLPALAAVERGWITALERGSHVELPDETLQAAVDAARATLLLGSTAPARRDRVVAAEAAAWGLAAGRPPRVRTRDAAGDPWPRLKAAAVGSAATPRSAAEWLRALRSALVRVTRDGVAFLPYFPVEWLGEPVAAHEILTGLGPVSFALRWHGTRPALLWETPAAHASLRVHAPALDPAWEGTPGAGEALLAEIDPTRLLPLGSAIASKRGVVVDEPGSFM